MTDQTKPDRVKLTGLWEKTTKNGQRVLSGSLGIGANIVIYENSYKKTENDPTHILCVETKLAKREYPKPAAKAAPVTKPVVQPSAQTEVDFDNIPF